MTTFSPSGSLLTACDLCHIRKVRCDRQDPCNRCTGSASRCVRTRQIYQTRRKRRPWLHASRASEAQVQSPCSSPGPMDSVVARPSLLMVNDGSRYRNPEPGVTTGRERPSPRLEGLGSLPAEASPFQSNPSERDAPEGSSPASGACRLAAGFEARPYLENELAQNNRLSRYQREILEIALDSVHQMGKETQNPAPEVPSGDDLDFADLNDPAMYPSAEVLFFLLGSSRTRSGEFHSELASIISSDSFERMAFALVDQQVTGHARAEYIVCVNFFSLTLTIGLEAGGTSDSFRQRLKPIQERYRRNAFKALNHISMLSTPNLSLLQALLAGAMLFQMAGNVAKCAQLSAAACLICSQLGGRYFAELAKGSSKQESLEARQCLGHCFILDKSLSMSLGRRSFLPDMDVNASMLIPPTLEMPSTPIFNVYIEFAKVQDNIAVEARMSSSRSTWRRIQAIQSLCQRLEQIREKIDTFQSQPPHSTDHLLQGEWMGVDFMYFNIMTAILRLHPDFSTCPNIRENCMNNARKSLHALQNMELHGLKSDDNHNAYCHSVSWIVLLYPLCPVFALFCHVVETAEKQDLELLHDVTQGLSMFAEFNKSMDKVKEWCNILVLLGRSCVDDVENV